MPRRELSDDATREVLATQGVVRVAFRDGTSPYLIPLGYVWVGEALCGVSDAGRKTRLAQEDPNVSFQVDTSGDTGLWEWRSVTGRGTFDIVHDDGQKRSILDALKPIIGRAPAWWQRQQAPHLASGALLVWRITPRQLAGCEYARPDDATEEASARPQTRGAGS